MATCRLPPFQHAQQLVDDNVANRVVDQRASSAQVLVTRTSVASILERELDTVVLNDMYKWLWMVAKKSSQHVDSLHKHMFKNRKIIIVEDPALHLVWFYDRVFLKPIPEVLLNYSFWINYLVPQAPQSNQPQGDYTVDSLSHACKHALGFLRSYSLLIQHESDFNVAKESKLLPANIAYHDFEDFIVAFRAVDDDAVSRRYEYGQFRMTRLNWAVRIFRPAAVASETWLPWYYHETRWQTGDYLRDYGAVAIFIFAMLSLILSSMQVMLAARNFTSWSVFIRFSWIFSILVMVFCVTLVFIGVLGISAILLAQAWFAIRTNPG